jgi:hypothetical protein
VKIKSYLRRLISTVSTETIAIIGSRLRDVITKGGILSPSVCCKGELGLLCRPIEVSRFGLAALFLLLDFLLLLFLFLQQLRHLLLDDFVPFHAFQGIAIVARSYNHRF